jgi:putative RecB family exonuclease
VITNGATLPQDTTAAALMAGTAWLADGSGMTITDVSVLNRLRRAELSVSTSHSLTVDSCATAMVASRILPRDDDAFEANQLGTAAHGALEIMFGMPAAERSKQAATDIINRLAGDRNYSLAVFDEDLADRIQNLPPVELQRWLHEVERRVHGLWDIEDPTAVEVHATEMSFGGKTGEKVMVGRVPFIGFIDRVDTIRDEAGHIVGFGVVDYKAGKVKQPDRFGDDYGDQIRLYHRAVQNHTGLPVAGGDLHFITYGVGRRVDVSPASVDAAVAKFERAWDRMHALAEANTYPTVDGPLCGWCPLVNVCPSAKANGRKDLTNTDKVNGKRVAVEGKELRGIPENKINIPVVSAPIVDNAAHRDVNEDNEEQENPMIESATPIKEGTSAREDTADGVMNGNSFAAIAVFGLVSLAVDDLAKAGQPVTKSTVTALSYTYAQIVQTVQFAMSGSARYGEGLNSRLRGALRTTVETMPAPFGADRPAWDAWVTSATNRTKAIAIVATDLFAAGTDIPDSPWAVLANSTAN